MWCLHELTYILHKCVLNMHILGFEMFCYVANWILLSPSTTHCWANCLHEDRGDLAESQCAHEFRSPVLECRLGRQKHNDFIFFAYCISSYSFHGNYSFLNLEIQRSLYIRPKVTVHTYVCGNYLREETIQGRKLYEDIR